MTEKVVKISIVAVIAKLVFAVGSFFLAQTVQADPGNDDVMPEKEQHVWSRYLRDFRGEHNFGASFGYTATEWNLGEFGVLSNQKISTTGTYIKANYSFYLPLFGQLGYMLGSSVGYVSPGTCTDPRFSPPPSTTEMPGLVVGLLYNISETTRVQLWEDFHLSRVSRLRLAPVTQERVDFLHVTMETIDSNLALDFFFKLQWALRIEISVRRSVYFRPQNSSDMPVDTKFERSARMAGIGITYNYF